MQYNGSIFLDAGDAIIENDASGAFAIKVVPELGPGAQPPFSLYLGLADEPTQAIALADELIEAAVRVRSRALGRLIAMKT